MTYTRRLLRTFLCVQIIVLTLTLAAFGATLAAERTRFIAQGAPAAARQETPLPIISLMPGEIRLPDKQSLHRALSFAAALPAPVGCAAALVCSFRNVLAETDFWRLDIFNKIAESKSAN